MSTALWNPRRLLGAYLLLIAAAVCEMVIPGVLHAILPIAVVASAFLLVGFAGSVIHSRKIRAIGWIGVVLFTLVVLFNSLFSVYFLAEKTWANPPTAPREIEFDWRLPLFWAHNVLLIVCFKQLGDFTERASKRFYLLCGYALTAIGTAYVSLQFERPTAGDLWLEYAGRSPNGVFWDFTNYSSRALYLTLETGDPLGTTTICRKGDDRREDRGPLHAGTVELRTVKIVFAQRVRLNIRTTLPAQFKGGSCRLRLGFRGGTFVESKEFTPD
jgi:hypothetical protein